VSTPRRAIVTGASSGLGKLFARTLVEAGWEVHGTSRSVDRWKEKDLAGVIPWELDLSLPASRESFATQYLAQLGAPDLYLGNAGSGWFGPYGDMEASEETRVWEILLHGPLDLIRRFAGPMKERGSGMILSVSSLAGEMPIPYCAVYNGAKAALSQTVQTLMLEEPGPPWYKDIRLGDFRTRFNDAMARQSPASGDAIAVARWERAWQAVEHHMEQSPEVDRLASRLLATLARPRHETVRWGSFFQAILASRFSPLLPSRLLRGLIARYYGISR